ncbi:hypothetical protein DSO57_1004018 [Entomophthora muscae]|uniref:Uncharacterized protein n=1 Tax=Entomophthora muscae TaxID=34485 RepID=A0ACC2SLB2_9FUNG|nr:hypothetical protein DSO57_1004018 [Entomophthora muscae]
MPYFEMPFSKWRILMEYILSALSFWVDNPEIYEHLKPSKCARTKDTELPVQLLAAKKTKPVKAAGKEDTKEGYIKN